MTLTIRTPEQLTAEGRDRLRARLKARRDVAIAAGTTVGGLPVQTDDLSQQRIVGAALAASLDPEATVRWKLANGEFATLTAAQIIGIAKAVRAHVQACFDHEAALLADLVAGVEVDIDAGWPGV